MTRLAVFLRLWPVLLLAGALWGTTTAHAHGTSWCSPIAPANTTTDAGTIIVFPTTAASAKHTAIGPWIVIAPQTWHCNVSQTLRFRLSLPANGSIKASNSKLSEGGKQYRLYHLIQQGEPVVGFITEHAYGLNGVEQIAYKPIMDTDLSAEYDFKTKIKKGDTVTGWQRVRFFHLPGKKVEGTFSFQVARRRVTGEHGHVEGTGSKRTASLNVTFQTLNQPCDVVVPQKVELGTVFTHEIPAVGDVATKSTPFDIEFKDCPVGYNSIRYRFESVGASPRAGTLPMLPASEAKGVGVEVRDSHDAPLFFTEDFQYILTQYGSNPGQTLYKVPLKARFIRTAQEVTPGQAQARLRLYVQYN